MADTNQDAQEQSASFTLTRNYLKDLSLELPNAPQIFLEGGDPVTQMELNIETQQLSDEFHEIAIQATVTTKVGEKVLFLVQGKQAGIFSISGIPADQLQPVLEIMGANVVYPYLRANLADAVTRTGLPPIHLGEVNFEAFYQQRRAAETPPTIQ